VNKSKACARMQTQPNVGYLKELGKTIKEP